MIGDEEEVDKSLQNNAKVQKRDKTVKFFSFKLDVSRVIPELMCPFGHMNDVYKLETEQ